MEKKPELRILNDGQSLRRGMNRREMVRRLLGSVSAGVFLPGVAAGHAVHKHLANTATLEKADTTLSASDWSPEFLDPHQNETLTILAERIVPGSTKAQVNRFIDLLLGVDTQENQKKFLVSLGAIEAESLKRFGHPFIALTEDQQNEILTVASTEKSGHPEGEGDWSWFAVPSKETPEPPRATLRDHFENLKGWISGAYYSSEIGMRELGWTGEVYFDSFPGCQHPEGHH